MNIFIHTDYREALRAVMKEKAARGERLTLRKLADRLAIQHTYLSKVLGAASSTHLGEDALSDLCAHLGLTLEEEEFIVTLRAFAVSQSARRRKGLMDRIQRIRDAHTLDIPQAQSDRLGLERETAYLLNPLTVLLHAALSIPKFQATPLELSEVLGVAHTEIRKVLDQLVDSKLIELSADRRRVTKTLWRDVHLGTDHPLMRSHQTNLRLYGIAKLMRLSEERRKAFTVAFTADNAAYVSILHSFEKFLQEVREITKLSPNTTLYQMNFDLFPWS